MKRHLVILYILLSICLCGCNNSAQTENDNQELQEPVIVEEKYKLDKEDSIKSYSYYVDSSWEAKPSEEESMILYHPKSEIPKQIGISVVSLTDPKPEMSVDDWRAYLTSYANGLQSKDLNYFAISINGLDGVYGTASTVLEDKNVKHEFYAFFSAGDIITISHTQLEQVSLNYADCIFNIAKTLKLNNSLSELGEGAANENEELIEEKEEGLSEAEESSVENEISNNEEIEETNQSAIEQVPSFSLKDIKAKTVFNSFLSTMSSPKTDNYPIDEAFVYNGEDDTYWIEVWGDLQDDHVCIVLLQPKAKNYDISDYKKIINDVFAGNAKDEATAWINNNIGKENSTKIGDANIKLQNNTSGAPILAILGEGWENYY